MAIKKGDAVKVHYKGTLDDGSVFDSSEGRAPLEFVAGAGQMIPGFDKAVIGMSKGEKKKIHIAPEEAYGEFDPGLIEIIPRSRLPRTVDPKPGMMLSVSTGDGRRIEAKISKVTAEQIMLDCNHPLAGKALNFEITIV